MRILDLVKVSRYYVGKGTNLYVVVSSDSEMVSEWIAGISVPCSHLNPAMVAGGDIYYHLMAAGSH